MEDITLNFCHKKEVIEVELSPKDISLMFILVEGYTVYGTSAISARFVRISTACDCENHASRRLPFTELLESYIRQSERFALTLLVDNVRSMILSMKDHRLMYSCNLE